MNASASNINFRSRPSSAQQQPQFTPSGPLTMSPTTMTTSGSDEAHEFQLQPSPRTSTTSHLSQTLPTTTSTDHSVARELQTQVQPKGVHVVMAYFQCFETCATCLPCVHCVHRVPRLPRSLSTLILCVVCVQLVQTCLFAAINFVPLFERSVTALAFVVVGMLALYTAALLVLSVKGRIFRWEDYWSISKEFKRYGWWLLCTMLVCLGAGLAPLASENENTHHTEQIVDLVLDLAGSVFVVGFAYVMVVWVRHQHKRGQTVDVFNIEAAVNADKGRRFSSTTTSTRRESSTARGRLDSLQINKLHDFFRYKGGFADYANARAEFRAFEEHCRKELSHEHLLYWVTIVQLLEFLGELGVLEEVAVSQSGNAGEDISPRIFPLKAGQTVKHLMRDVAVIEQLKKDFHGSLEADYELLGRCYVNIFKMFIERNVSEFELNLESALRDKMTRHYKFIVNSNEGVVDEKLFFDYLWTDLKSAAMVSYRFLQSSFNRFQQKDSGSGNSSVHL